MREIGWQSRAEVQSNHRTGAQDTPAIRTDSIATNAELAIVLTSIEGVESIELGVMEMLQRVGVVGRSHGRPIWAPFAWPGRRADLLMICMLIGTDPTRRTSNPYAEQIAGPLKGSGHAE